MDKNVAKFFLILAVNSWQRIAEGPYSLQPCPAQGRKHALDDRWILVGEHLFEDLQRDMGSAPTVFACGSSGFLFSACLAVKDSQFIVGGRKVWVSGQGFLLGSNCFLHPPRQAIGSA